MAARWPYCCRILAVSWLYSGRIIAISWSCVVAVSWPYIGCIEAFQWPLLICQFPAKVSHLFCIRLLDESVKLECLPNAIKKTSILSFLPSPMLLKLVIATVVQVFHGAETRMTSTCQYQIYCLNQSYLITLLAKSGNCVIMQNCRRLFKNMVSIS